MKFESCYFHGCKAEPSLALVCVFAWTKGRDLKTRACGVPICSDHRHAIEGQIEAEMWERAGEGWEVRSTGWETVAPDAEAVRRWGERKLDELFGDLEPTNEGLEIAIDRPRRNDV